MKKKLIGNGWGIVEGVGGQLECVEIVVKSRLILESTLIVNKSLEHDGFVLSTKSYCSV